MLFVEYPKCSTCRKAKQWLKDNGIDFTDRDITVRCTALGAAPDAMKVGEVMTRGAVTIDERAHVGEAARLMADARIRRLPVCRSGVMVGMLSLGDLARSTDCDTEAAAALSEISQNIRRL